MMVQNSSLATQTKKLEQHILSVLSSLSIDTVSKATNSRIFKIKRDVIDAKLDIRDYEFSESAAEQSQYAADAKKRFTRIHTQIVELSEYNIFAPADVAQLGAQIEQIIEELS